MERLAADLIARLASHHLPTVAHSRRVAALCVAVGGDALYLPALLHDAGKRLVPAAILDAPRRLEPLERACIEDHARYGVVEMERAARRRRGLVIPRPYLDAALSHHERWDGRGYPDHMAGEAIPRIARLVALCDVYDAIVSADRPWRRPCSHEEALAELERGAGTQFDPALTAWVVATLRRQPALGDADTLPAASPAPA